MATMRSRTSRAGPAARANADEGAAGSCGKLRKANDTSAPVRLHLDEQNSRRRRQAGFSLIELMAVVAIIAVMTTSVLMLTRTSSRGATLKATAVAIAAQLKTARTNAMRYRRDEVVVIDMHRRHLVRQGSNEITRIGEEINLLMLASDAERLSAQVAGIRFFPNGSSSGATLRLVQNDERYDVRVDWLTGRVAVEPAT